MLRHKKEFQAV